MSVSQREAPPLYLATQTVDRGTGWLPRLEAALQAAGYGFEPLPLDAAGEAAAPALGAGALVIVPVPDDARLSLAVERFGEGAARHPLLLVEGLGTLSVDLSATGYPLASAGLGPEGRVPGRGVGPARRQPQGQAGREQRGDERASEAAVVHVFSPSECRASFPAWPQLPDLTGSSR
ncbi:MAG: hypothetical protein P1V51_22945 [Deltaproteobacteria bacterium]|nr:hypothetical protein [Deltaproteobacteria bacterium]